MNDSEFHKVRDALQRLKYSFIQHRVNEGINKSPQGCNYANIEDPIFSFLC